MTLEIAIKHLSILTLFYVFYRVLLARTTFHAYNRMVLLTGAVISLLPLFATNSTREMVVYTIPQVALTAPIGPSISSTFQVNWFTDLYTWGVVVAALVLLVKAVRLALLFSRSKSSHIKGVRWIAEGQSPCSFLFWSFIPRDMDADLKEKVILHESSHLKMGHSIDVLIIEGLKIIFWFNPFIYLLQRHLVTLHEYQADQYAQRHSQAYTESILEYSRWKSQFRLASTINPYFVHLKNRINMLHQTPTKTIRKFFLLALLPIMMASVVITACEDPAEPVLENFDADELPEFKGGMQELGKYLQENLTYPESFNKKGEEQTVYLQFTIKSDGSVTDVGGVKGEYNELIQSCMDAMEKMPDWTPGQKDKKPVAIKMVLPIRCVPKQENSSSQSES